MKLRLTPPGFAHVFPCVWCRRQRRIEEPLCTYAMIPCDCGAWAYVDDKKVQQYKPLIGWHIGPR